MKLIKRLEKITDKFLLIVLIVSGVILASSVIFYAMNCFLRYAVKSPLAWPEEYCTYVIVLMVFLMQCRLEFYDESLSIAVVWEKVKDKPVPRRILFTFKGIVTILISVLMAHIGRNLTIQQFDYNAVTPVMRIPLGVYYAAIDICFLLIVVVWIVHIFTKRFE